MANITLFLKIDFQGTFHEKGPSFHRSPARYGANSGISTCLGRC
jgi:hypothetical protein